MSNFRPAAAYFRNHLPSLHPLVFLAFALIGSDFGASGAGHRPLLGNDLQANLPQAKRTSGRDTLRMLRTADGAHACFECGFPQSWPPRPQRLQSPPLPPHAAPLRSVIGILYTHLAAVNINLRQNILPSAGQRIFGIISPPYARLFFSRSH